MGHSTPLSYGTKTKSQFGPAREAEISVAHHRTTSAVISRVRSDSAIGLVPPMRPEPTLMITTQLRPLLNTELWIDGQSVHTHDVPIHGAACIDLESSPSSYLGSALDSFEFHLTRATLANLAERHETRPITNLSLTCGTIDPVIASLGQLLLPTLEHPERANPLFDDAIILALYWHLAVTYGGIKNSEPQRAGRLAPWQEQRAKEMIEAHLSGDLSIARLAEACRLPPVAQPLQARLQGIDGRAAASLVDHAPHRSRQGLAAAQPTRHGGDCASQRLCGSKPPDARIRAPGG